MNEIASPITVKFLMEFFKVGTLINCGIITIWTIIIMAMPDVIYKTHSRFFSMPKEWFHAIHYSFLGLYKIVITAFFVVPWLTLVIITGH